MNDDAGAGKAFTAEIHRALRCYRREADLAALDWLPTLAIVQAHLRRKPGLGLGGAVRAVLDSALGRLAHVDAEAAGLLVRRFVDKQSVRQVMREIDFSERAVYQRQRHALASLAQTIWQDEEQERRLAGVSQTQQAALDRLPAPTFSRLFGVEAILIQLKQYLLAQNSAWLVAIEGLGGIGKTALARQAVEEALRAGPIEAAYWITARQEIFAWGRRKPESRPALTFAGLLDELGRAMACQLPVDLVQEEAEAVRRIRAVLHQVPSLIVVDNLETAADVEALVQGLDRLARPTKILLTSRQRVAAYAQVTSLTLHELGQEEALAFLRHQAEERNVQALLTAPLALLARVVQITGGNPLAVKLVIGQMRSLPIERVLEDLAGARGQSRELYAYIYRYAWGRLSSLAQQLLLCMPLLDPRGAAWQDWAGVSGVEPDGEFCRAVEELLDFSLVNAGFGQGRMLYSIHRLTEYFLLSDLIGLDRPQVSL